MYLTSRQTDQVFRIMRDLTNEYDHREVRERVGQSLLALFDADFFASYIWDEAAGQFVERVSINMSDDNLTNYERHFQFCDPITPVLHRRRRATPVSAVMAHDRLARTEFFNDFLQRDGLHYGINFYARHHGRHVGDVRIWRARHRRDFDDRDAALLDGLGPALANAFWRRHPDALAVPAAGLPSWDDSALSAREQQVAGLLLEGATDAGVAARLGIGLATVRTHVRSVFRKCGCRGAPNWRCACNGHERSSVLRISQADPHRQTDHPVVVGGARHARFFQVRIRIPAWRARRHRRRADRVHGRPVAGLARAGPDQCAGDRGRGGCRGGRAGPTGRDRRVRSRMAAGAGQGQ
ncbi:MAG: helix-turn-helix transcriptional regulator [Burkholderiaceae bacterium]